MKISKGYFTPLSLGVFLFSLLLGLYISNFGNPYIFHPDEVFILKRPFKKLIEYSQFDFSNTFSLYDLLLIGWYGFYYLFGLVFNFWGDFNDFRQSIILEKFEIIYGGRILSCLFVAVGNFVYYCFLTKWYDKRIAIALILVFNPILIPSVFWIKYDALMYLAFAILYCTSFNYLLLKNSNYRSQIYLFGFVALSVRIEAILFMILFVLFDIAIVKSNKSTFFTDGILKNLAIGFLIWSISTLYPLHLLSKLWGGNEIGLLASKTYESQIAKSMVANLYNSEQLGASLFYYLKILLFLMGPIVILTMASLKDRKTLFYLIYIMCFIGVLILNGHESVYYILPIAPIILVIGLWVSKNLNPVWKACFLVTTNLYILSITLPFLILSRSSTDPRIAAREFILENTSETDTLAIATISMNGFHPLIDEFPSVLRKKAKRVAEFTGIESIGYLTKASNLVDSSECRYILDVFSNNYLNAAASGSNEFINTYDSAHLNKVKPMYFVSTMGAQVELIGDQYEQMETFTPYDFKDKRCNLLYSYSPEVRVYKRLK